MALFGGDSSSSQDAKTALVKQIQQEAAMNNARQLISKVNEHCFAHCIPRPGSTLSSRDETCLSQCMEKYISFWNTTSRTYGIRLASEQKKLGGQDAAAMAAFGTPSSE
ncbi:putative mitochondrial intermembrane space translocase subunit Tim13 [Aspergillus ellipticus CBS 707.79]|uniref:Mitochondrial import inner membrane translocase subunit n=1 Tax=Aspergillus ellipticus CBS 707.79 TaxID=1448320 RepID=A0A319D0L7_9EURO|nr:putative mitochondrial intermembrane space translocase subunit Tim13 [Aspergillus ellipticus CBS 707.79]